MVFVIFSKMVYLLFLSSRSPGVYSIVGLVYFETKRLCINYLLSYRLRDGPKKYKWPFEHY